MDRKYPYKHFEISGEQLEALLREHPERVVINEGAMLVLEASDPAGMRLHWAANNADDLVCAIQELQGNVRGEVPGKWYMSLFHAALADPLLQIGFGIESHYMDYWLYGIDDLALDASQQGYIRKSVPADFHRLSEISAECSYSPGWLEEPVKWYADWLADEYSDILVAETEGKSVGYCCVQLYGFDSEKGTVVWIRELAVAPTYQRRGLGRVLLLAGLKWGQSGHAQRSFVATDKRNHVARRLYESLGFRPSGAEEINLILSVG